MLNWNYSPNPDILNPKLVRGLQEKSVMVVYGTLLVGPGLGSGFCRVLGLSAVSIAVLFLGRPWLKSKASNKGVPIATGSVGFGSFRQLGSGPEPLTFTCETLTDSPGLGLGSGSKAASGFRNLGFRLWGSYSRSSTRAHGRIWLRV